MTVTAYDPNQLSATDSALRHIEAQILKSGHQHLRLGIRESGCNGYMYVLDFIDSPAAADVAFHIGEDVEVYVSEQDLPLVRGTELDYVIDGLNGTLRFNNPNAATHCGCGESFSLNPDS